MLWIILLAAIGIAALIGFFVYLLHRMDVEVRNERARFNKSAETYPEWRARQRQP